MPKKDKSDEEPSTAVLEEQPQARAIESGSPSGDVRPPAGIDRSKISAKALKMAEEFGIPLESIFQWAESVDARFQALQEALPEAVGVAVERTLVKLQNQSMQQQKQDMHDAIEHGEMPAGQRRGGGMGGLMDLLPLLTSGGGSNPLMEQLQGELLRASIDNMKAGAANSKAITDAVVGAITRKAIGGAVEQVVG